MNEILFPMKSSLVISVFIALTFFTCEHERENGGCDPACDPSRKTVKEVTDKEGRIDYSQDENKWMIITASAPVTYDAQDMGLVCSNLSEEFKQVGIKVRFTGVYKEKCDDDKGDFAGQTYYYLHISRIDLLNGN